MFPWWIHSDVMERCTLRIVKASLNKTDHFMLLNGPKNGGDKCVLSLRCTVKSYRAIITYSHQAF